MTFLWNQWPWIERALKAAPCVLLLCDFDGTLAPITERPEDAHLPSGVRHTLLRLASLQHCTLGFVSGRALADLWSRVRLPHCFYAGNYGLERQEPGMGSSRAHLSAAVRRALRSAGDLLKRSLGHVEGVLLEDKGCSLSLHYRCVGSSSLRQVEGSFAALTSQLDGQLAAHRGKKVLEIRPACGWDKGRTVSAIACRVQRVHGARPLIFYFGDDEGDEPAFVAITRRGYAVRVGNPKRSSAANYYLNSTAETAEFLDRVAGCLASGWRGRDTWHLDQPAPCQGQS